MPKSNETVFANWEIARYDPAMAYLESVFPGCFDSKEFNKNKVRMKLADFLQKFFMTPFNKMSKSEKQLLNLKGGRKIQQTKSYKKSPQSDYCQLTLALFSSAAGQAARCICFFFNKYSYYVSEYSKNEKLLQANQNNINKKALKFKQEVIIKYCLVLQEFWQKDIGSLLYKRCQEGKEKWNVTGSDMKTYFYNERVNLYSFYLSLGLVPVFVEEKVSSKKKQQGQEKSDVLQNPSINNNYYQSRELPTMFNNNNNHTSGKKVLLDSDWAPPSPDKNSLNY